MPTPWLELDAVEAYLGPRRVFQDLTLHLQEGEHTVLLGPNGAGKSALVHDLAVLVLDEPTNGLDLRARHQLLALLRQRAQAGTTLLLVTHQIGAILPEIRRCVFLRDGAVVGDGPAETLLQEGPLSALFGTPLQVVRAGGWHQVLPA